MNIHPLAAVSPQAIIGRDVVIHPFCSIEAGASIGDGCILESRAVIKSGTTLGCNNHVYEGAILGGLPQHIKMPEQVGTLVIGDSNTIRENVTIHRGLEDGHATVLGNNNLVMVNVHIAHDCRIGSHTIFANACQVAGQRTRGAAAPAACRASSTLST